MLPFETLTNETKKVALEIVSAFNPAVATAGSLFQWQQNISNAIFLEKLYRILMKQDSDFDEWLKISENYQKDASNYYAAVKQLIFTIDAINDTNMLDIYANLLHAYKSALLSKDDFFRLTWVLSNTYYDDLKYLERCRTKSAIAKNSTTTKLFTAGLLSMGTSQLMVQPNYTTAVRKSIAYNDDYHLSKLGLLMLACGLDYENYPTYKESLKAYET